MGRNHVARNRIVLEHQNVVTRIAERIRARLPGSVDLEDLISAGQFGLIDAAAEFDAERGVRFSTYATPLVRGAIIDSLRRDDWVSRNARAKVKRLADARSAIEQRPGWPGGSPTDAELAAEMRCTIETVRAWLSIERRASEIGSLSESAGDKLQRRSDMLLAPNNAPDENADRAARASELRALIDATLDQRERMIVLLYYYEGLTMREIAAVLKIQHSEVSRVHRSIKRRLEIALRERMAEREKHGQD